MGKKRWPQDHADDGLYHWMWTGKGPDWHQMAGGDLEVIYCKPVIEFL